MSDTSLELRSEITKGGKLNISLETVPMPVPGDDEVLIQVAAAPINPSDLGLLLGPADVSTMKVTGPADNPLVTMDVPEAMMSAMGARLDESLPVGNEGAGLVIDAGANCKRTYRKDGGCCWRCYVLSISLRSCIGVSGNE